MQYDAAHMGVVEIEHVAHLAVGKRRIKAPEPEVMSDHRRLRAAANHLIRQGQGGSVVIVSSAHAQVAIPTCMAYNMAKAALDQMARTAATAILRSRSSGVYLSG